MRYINRLFTYLLTYYCQGTIWCVKSVEVLPIAMQHCSTTSPEQIEVMKLEGYSGTMCNKHVHSTVMRSSRFCCLIGVINKLTTDELCISPVYQRLAVAKFSKSTSRNCSRDPDHTHLRNTHSLQDKDFAWPTRVQNLKSLALAVAEILRGV